MKNKEILEKAIQRAIDNGWDSNNPALQYVDWNVLKPEDAFRIIYSHDFAKALWGEELEIAGVDNDYEAYWIPNWQYQLQKMVIADAPIKYLADNI